MERDRDRLELMNDVEESFENKSAKESSAGNGEHPGVDDTLGDAPVHRGKAARGAEEQVYGEEGSASERIGSALRRLAEAVQLDPRLAPTLELLRSAGAEVEEAVQAGAAEQILVIDEMVRNRKVADLLERAERTRARVTVFSSLFDPGQQLAALVVYAVIVVSVASVLYGRRRA